MPFETLSTQPDDCTENMPNFEFLTIEPALTEIPEIWNSNPKILDAGAVAFICQSGTGKLVIDMNTFEIRKGSFCLLLPFTVIQVLEYSDDISITAIAAGVNFLERLTMFLPVEDYATLIQENPCLLFTDEQLKEVEEIYNFVTKRVTNKNRHFATEIRDTLLMYMALEAVSMYASYKPSGKRKLSRQESIFRNFTISLAKNIRQHREVDFYAQQACLSPRHFSDTIKKKSGKLPTQWIAERTILMIKFLLENTEMSIQEIAEELNFPNQSFFSKYFRKHTGSTPKAYRRG